MRFFSKLSTVSLLVLVPYAVAQTSIRVAVINGHTGQPVVGAHVSVMIIRNYQGATVDAAVESDKYGVQVQQGDTLVLENVTKSNRSWNEYKLCASEPDSKPTYSVAAILSRGLQAPNNCDRHITSMPVAGEVVFFVRRLSFWERYRPFTD